VHKLIEDAYQKALSLLKGNKKKVDKLAQVLLEKEVIFKEDLEGIFGKRTYKRDLEREIEIVEEKKRMKERLKKVKEEIENTEAGDGSKDVDGKDK